MITLRDSALCLTAALSEAWSTVIRAAGFHSWMPGPTKLREVHDGWGILHLLVPLCPLCELHLKLMRKLYLAQHWMHCCKPVDLDWWVVNRNESQIFSYRIMDSTHKIKHAYFEREEKNLAVCCLYVANGLKSKNDFGRRSILFTYVLLYYIEFTIYGSRW